MTEKDPCPCFSGVPYRECCQPFHKGALPHSAVQMMRSRFAAYRLNLPKYIIATTHPDNLQYNSNWDVWEQEISHFSLNTIFKGLKILFHEERQDHASVIFEPIPVKFFVDFRDYFGRFSIQLMRAILNKYCHHQLDQKSVQKNPKSD
jgi:SEC-C motif-containing protein